MCPSTMMTFKKVVLASLIFFLSSAAFSQIIKPAKWTASLSTATAKVGDEIELILNGTIDDGWYAYSVGFDPDCGPIPASVTLDNTKDFILVGELRADHDKVKFDKIFECEVKIFEKTGTLRQKIKIASANPSLKMFFDGQACTERDGKCVPFSEEFDFTLAIAPGSNNKTEVVKTGKPVLKPDDQPEKTDSATTQIPSTSQQTETNNTVNSGPVLDTSVLDRQADTEKDSFIGLLIFAFLAGLTSLITPCVFPMIPMTVTFFLKDNQSKKQGIRNAIIFGISIVAIYTSAGTLFAVLLGAEGLNALATHWAPNLFIFVIFILFAFSFFGVFEITAPHQLVNKIDRQAEKGGLIGIFFIAATLVLVSFSCTVPIVGSALFLSAGGEILRPILSMFAYSVAFALPFTLFAAFPEWIKGLPKSGGWLNSVKVVLAFLELALSLKFLSIVDVTYHWGILDREINLALWIVIFSLLGFYLLGKIRMQHDSPVEKITISRLMLAIATFSFVIYLIPGLWGAPLKALAGYLPPMYTHDFDLVALNRKDQAAETCEEPKYADLFHLPHGLLGYFDYDQALACARQQKKPLFIDFTGHGCTNCREMEAVVWSDPRVLDILRNDYVIAGLYVDDKTDLPETEWYTSKADGKVKKTIGKQNADLQIVNLNNNAQPFYVLVGQDERVLAWPYDYNRDVEKFIEFLEGGKKKYRELYGE